MFDQAQEREEEMREAAIAAARPAKRQGADVCVDCGGLIPVDRHRAAPGARRCVDCQTWLEGAD